MTEDTYHERIARAEPRHGDLLYSREGTYFGIAAAVPPGIRVCLGQRMVLLRPEPSIVDSEFLRFWLNSPVMALHVQGFRDGTVAERLNLPMIRQLPVPLPPLREQRAIAHILGTLDEKIELNRLMNETLESMARALFKSWFIDFDPVRARTEGRDPGLPKEVADLFPDCFETSEAGRIPKSWTTRLVSEMCEAIFSGGTPSTKTAEYWGGGIPWLSSGETRAKFIAVTERTITAEGVAASSTRLARTGATVIASAGQGHTRGQTSMLMIDSYINQSVVALQADQRYTSDTHLFFDLERRYEQFRGLSDAHSSRGSLTTKLLGGVRCVIPPRNLVRAFDRITAPVLRRIAASTVASSTLATLRDTLLPKLVSGELGVNDAERFVGRHI